MEYNGKLYAKIAGKYIDCTQTINDLENEIKFLKRILFSEQEMIDCFTAGVNFARDRFNNPSYIEYIELIKNSRNNL